MNKEVYAHVFVTPEMKSEDDPLPMLRITNDSDALICITRAMAYVGGDVMLNDFLDNLVGLTIPPHSFHRFIIVGDDMQNPPSEEFIFALELEGEILLKFDISFKFRNMFMSIGSSKPIKQHKIDLKKDYDYFELKSSVARDIKDIFERILENYQLDKLLKEKGKNGV